jgi:5-enolpyruvylshikimate-3-phosphate synthase
MLYNLRQLGVRCEVLKKKSGECLTIEGIGKFGREPRFKSFGDHRTAMACVVAGLLSARRTFIDEVQCINKSFPAFMGIVRALYKL